MEWILEKIKKAETKIAVIYEGKSFSYKQLDNKIVQYSIELEENIPKGAVVAIVSDYNFFSISLFLSLVNNNNIIVPLITSITKEERTRNIEIGYVEHVIEINEKGELLFKEINIEKTHASFEKIKRKNVSGLVLFSSGTTGKPKA